MTTEGYVTAAGTALHYDPTIDATTPTGLWADCPLLEFASNPSIGMMIREDWKGYDTTDLWTLTQATTGAAAMSTAMSGVLELDSNSTTVTQGANLQMTAGGFIVPVASTKTWAEFSFKIVDTYDDCELFVGISEADTTLIGTSANSSANHIGWQCVTDDGVLLFTSEKAGAGDTSTATTLTEAGWVKLGFYVDGISTIQQYVNGVATGTAHATANCPIVKLIPSFVCQSGGTADPIMHIKPFTIFHLYA